MKPPVETFDSPAAFTAAVKAAARGARARKPRRPKEATAQAKAALSGAQSEPGQGDRLLALSRLAEYRLMPRWRAGIGFDFWASDGRTTTAHATYAAAVVAAEQEAINEK